MFAEAVTEDIFFFFFFSDKKKVMLDKLVYDWM